MRPKPCVCCDRKTTQRAEDGSPTCSTACRQSLAEFVRDQTKSQGDDR